MADPREFLMLAHDYKPGKDDVRGWYVSEKLDGFRAFWDGGVSRGKPTREVPWANLDKTVKPVATGLWTRYGNVVSAPDWWLDQLPMNMSLDGEIWIDRQMFQAVRSACSKHVPIDAEWRDVKFLVFESPSFDLVFQNRTVKNQNFTRELDKGRCLAYIKEHGSTSLKIDKIQSFTDTLERLKDNLDRPHIHVQETLSIRSNEVDLDIQRRLEEVTLKGGEGLMLRNPKSFWVPTRTRNLLKVKKLDTSEGVVTGFIAGIGKYKGMLGSLTLKLANGKHLNLSGFTDEERTLLDGYAQDWAMHNEGCIMPTEHSNSSRFKLGTTVSFIYRDLSDDGIPKEARYKR